jgi:hypothetical protein
MQTLRLDLLKFTGVRQFQARDGTAQIAIPVEANNIFVGKQGLYCDITLMDNRDGTDQYGNDGFAVQDIGKERRLAGEKGPIIGKWKHVGATQAKPAPAPPAPVGDDCDEIPF